MWWSSPSLRKLTHTPEISSRNRHVKSIWCHANSGAGFSCSCTTSNVTDCLQASKAVNDVINHALAWKTGTEIGCRILIYYAYGTDFWRRFLEHVLEALEHWACYTYCYLLSCRSSPPIVVGIQPHVNNSTVLKTVSTTTQTGAHLSTDEMLSITGKC